MQKHNGSVSLHGSSSMRFDNLRGADGMKTQERRIAERLSMGLWLSELDLMLELHIRNPGGRISDLRLKRGMTVKDRWVNKPNGKQSHKIYNVTKTELKRVFGRT